MMVSELAAQLPTDLPLRAREGGSDVVAMARVEGWKRVLLVASAYHLPRALLSFITSRSCSGLQSGSNRRVRSHVF